MKPRTQDDYIRTALRVPPDLHKRIHAAAAESGRTFNAEINVRLEGSFGQAGADQEQAEGLSIGLKEPEDRAALLKTLLLEELMVLKRRVDDLGGRNAVLEATKAELVSRITGPKIEGTGKERKSHLTRVLDSYPLTTLLTDDEVDKLAERIVAVQETMANSVRAKQATKRKEK